MPLSNGTLAAAGRSNGRAIALMALSMSALAANDSIVRYIGASVPVGEVMVVRGVALCLILIAGCRLSGQSIQIGDLLHRWCLLRGGAEVLGTYLFLMSLNLLPIALATTLVFTAPIILTALSGPLFGEKVGIWRWCAVLAGFSGVMLITAPGTEFWQPAMALPVAVAAMVVLRDICTRFVADHVTSGAVSLTTAIAVTLGGTASLFWSQWVPVTIVQSGWLILAAAIIGVSFFSYIVAVRMGELAAISPVQYLIILWAVFYGAVVWGEYPGPRQIAGGLVIVVSGLLILYREHVRHAERREEKYLKGGADA